MVAKGSSDSKKTDRRILRTRKAISDAFEKLVIEEGIEKITVSALAREADIDRKTFYLHYSSVNDLMDQLVEQHMERILNAAKKHATSTPAVRVHAVLEEVNAVILENKKLFANLSSSLSNDQIIGLLSRSLRPALVKTGIADMPEAKVVDDFEVLVRLRFVVAGALSLYTGWFSHGCSVPIETVSATIEEAAINGVVPLVQNA